MTANQLTKTEAQAVADVIETTIGNLDESQAEQTITCNMWFDVLEKIGHKDTADKWRVDLIENEYIKG